MKSSIRHIGVLTSGGDSPGMNAAIRAVVRTGVHHGLKVSGIYRGYQGMMDDEIELLGARSVAHIISRGGTILKSSRCEAFRTPEGRTTAAGMLRGRNIDALVVIGGDGSMKGAGLLQQEHGIDVIGLPGTIDNDIYGSDFTIGYDTAVNVAVECIDKIRDTATSHDRLFLVEVMGRDTGHIALRTAVASGAVAVLMPEDPLGLDELSERLNTLRGKGKTSSIVVVAEGNPHGGAHKIAAELEASLPDYEKRVTVLGHIQRGGSPTVADRILATRLGTYAVEALLKGRTRCMVGIMKGTVSFTPFEKAINQNTGFDSELYRISRIASS